MSSTHITGKIDFRVGINPPDYGEYIVLSEDHTISTAWWNGEDFISIDFINVIAWAEADEEVFFSPNAEKKLAQMTETY